MVFVRLFCAYGLLFCMSAYISSNLQEILFGSGYGLLIIVAILFFSLVAMSGDLFNLLWLRRAAYFLLVFFAYFAIKYYLESEDSYATRQQIIGTSSGVVFAFGIGFFSSYALAAIYELRQERLTYRLALIFGTVYLVFVLIVSWQAFQSHLSTVRTDLFVIEDQYGYYQRAGNLVLIQIMLVASLSTVLLVTARKLRWITSLPYLMVILTIGAIFGLMSQLVGSNSGLVATVGFLFVYMVNFFVLHLRGGSPEKESIKISKLLSTSLGVKLLAGSLLAVGVIGVAGLVTIDALNIDVSTLRISGFGSGEVSSVESRKEIFRDGFTHHFFYSAFSPLFGNTQVHLLTGRLYAHSLFAILTHLGIFGFAVFCGIIYCLYIDITEPNSARSGRLFIDRQYGLFRLLALSTIIVMGIYSAFFTWMPLWFAIGFFGEWYYRPQVVDPFLESAF